ncbi:hypothetical protein MSG28_007384 [Choristoneura fumiferana]|uniref:Uncharacterized protein n=1 Tax=Choristoneura fumiferana TaxID=7141 RepID=A0ACC0JX07_CHOFU|nr:hypothetical protein MSG28_007384 [Choristoneura fumiferana]
MEDIYDDLENFNDVNVVNELRAENDELKQKLAQYADSMTALQKDYDNLSAELKKLETNYSSLLKSARAEIKRKTDMIKNLNIEKDMLVLKQFQDKPDHRQKLMNVYKVKAEGNVKKKNNPNRTEDLKQREEFRKSPSDNSSTATEKSSKSLSTENKVGESAKTIARNTSKENEPRQNEAFPDHRENYHDDKFQGGSVTDRRISTLTSQQFLKFSSDEEFEDMYSALEPKTSKNTSLGDEPQRSQKRVRDEPQHCRVYNESSGPQDKRINYNDTPRDSFNKNRSRRFYENERNMIRDKHDLPYPIRNKYSPDRARYGKREFGDDRFFQQFDRHRWMENGERYQQRRRERRPYPDRGRSDQNPDMDRNYYSDTYAGKNKLASLTQIHGDYDQPPLKRFRGDQYPHTDEVRRNERQVPHEHHPFKLREAYQQSQINDELVNSIYADLDKPVSDSAIPPGDGTINKGIQDVNHDMGIPRHLADMHDPQSTKKDNVKDNLRSKHTEEKLHEEEKSCKISKYKIPLKGQKINTDVVQDTKSNKTETIIHSSKDRRPSLLHKDSPSVNDSIKIPNVAKTVESSKWPSNAESKSVSAKILKMDKNEAESNILEQKLSSIRNIVEGDLELSDETIDDTQVQLKENELPDTKKKHKIKKKSHRDISKDKTPTRKTRSKTDKDKDAKARNKFIELFGDSSSLIAPEDLELAPKLAPTQTANSYSAVCEDALDGIPLQVKQNNVRTLAAKKEISGPDLNAICPKSDSLHLEEKNKSMNTKDNKSRVHYNKHKKSDVLLSKDVKDLNDINLSDIVNSTTAHSGKTTLLSEEEKKMEEQLDRNKSAKEFKIDDLGTALVAEVQIAESNKKCKDTPKGTKLEVSTAATSDKPKEIYVNKPIQIIKSNTIETHSKPKVKAVAPNEECTETKTSNSESNVVVAHLMPEVKAVASFEKCKETSNAYRLDGKTESDVVDTHVISDVKLMTLVENSEEASNTIRPDKDINSNAVASEYTISEVRIIASSETSEETINQSKLGKKIDPTAGTPLIIEEKPAVSRDKSKDTRNVTKSEKKTKSGSLKCNEKNKDHAKSNKNSKEDKMFPFSEAVKDSNITENQIIAELNKPAINNSNKENESCGEAIDNDLPKVFEDTLVPIENMSLKTKTDEEKLTVEKESKEIVSNTRIDDTPNLEAVTEDIGLVNTIVISSGVQPPDANVVQINTSENQFTPLKALATSTPTRELSTCNTSSEIQPSANTLTSSVNIKPANENLVSKNDESDIPDVRIYCYRRRRKLVR